MKIPSFTPRSKRWGQRLTPLQLKVTPGFKKGLRQFSEDHGAPMNVVVETTLAEAYPELRKAVNQAKKEHGNGKQEKSRDTERSA